MPIVAAYFGTSGVYCVFFDEKRGLKHFSFPVLDYSLLTKSDFDLVFKDYLPGCTNIEIIGTGTFENIPENLNLKLYVPLNQVINRLKPMYTYAVSNFCVQTPDNISTGLYLPEPSLDEQEMSLYGNMSIYPHIVPVDLNSEVLLDKNITQFYKSGLKQENTIKKRFMPENILFTGERFFHKRLPELSYLLILNCINEPGFYPLYIDRNASFILSVLYEIYLGEKMYDPNIYVEKVGTLVRVSSACECLVSSDIATSQFFDLKENTLNLVPLNIGSLSKVHLKAAGEVLEKQVEGGTLGIIFDTRANEVDVYSEVKYFNVALKNLQSSLGGF